tara:strand:+ start:5733 stop:6398 length:666 start_codon:yes stop_codon:yes gene_type:complete
LVDKVVNIVIFGPPGAGKGTQANNLVKEFNLNKVSTGDLLRKEIKKKTKLGIDIENIINKGKLVSDEIINKLLENISSKKENHNRLIFDGYPRKLSQVKNLDKMLNKHNQKISCVLSLNVNLDIVIKRILGREICSECGLTFNKFFNPANKENHKCDSKFLQKRTDDNEEIVKNRYDTYSKETLPILKYYQNQNLLYEIEGKGEIATIYEEIRRIIRSLET